MLEIAMVFGGKQEGTGAQVKVASQPAYCNEPSESNNIVNPASVDAVKDAGAVKSAFKTGAEESAPSKIDKLSQQFSRSTSVKFSVTKSPVDL